mmetsp:Transcript_144542/g.366883  ORF Transcript_144542/g.366883 Transcript_144542/m.366883 type:complete len:256 (-) Transcript_144542:837-1604(-)
MCLKLQPLSKFEPYGMRQVQKKPWIRYCLKLASCSSKNMPSMPLSLQAIVGSSKVLSENSLHDFRPSTLRLNLAMSFSMQFWRNGRTSSTGWLQRYPPPGTVRPLHPPQAVYQWMSKTAHACRSCAVKVFMYQGATVSQKLSNEGSEALTYNFTPFPGSVDRRNRPAVSPIQSSTCFSPRVNGLLLFLSMLAMWPGSFSSVMPSTTPSSEGPRLSTHFTMASAIHNPTVVSGTTSPPLVDTLSVQNLGFRGQMPL